MHCSNWGQDVPLESQVCPFCKVDKNKSHDLSTLTGTVACVFAGAIFGFFAGSTAGISAALVYMFVGMLVFGVAGALAFMAPVPSTERIASTVQTTQDGTTAGSTPAVQEPPFDVVASIATHERTLLASGYYRKCPHCAEVIKAEASVCRFCQRDVAGPPVVYVGQNG